MRKIIKARCVYCKREYEKLDIPEHNNNGIKSGIRSCNTVTCSPKCSKEYQRIRQ